MKKLKKLSKKVLLVVISITMLISTSTTSFAYSPNINKISTQKSVVVTDEGVYINNTYYSQREFIQLLYASQKVEMPKRQVIFMVQNTGEFQIQSATVALAAGTWYIPGVGQVVITVTGAVIVAGVAVKVGSWLYNTISDWFTTRAEISEAKSKIPERLKDGNGNVKIGDFNQKLKQKNVSYKEKGGWIIEKDTSGHGGKKWKLKDKSKNRVASLDENGKVLGK